MKTFNTIYENYYSLNNFIKENNIDSSETILVQVFTGVCDYSFINFLLKEIKSLLPKSKIIGTTTAGEIVDCNVTQNNTVISFSTFQNTSLESIFLSNYDDDFQLGVDLANGIISSTTKLILLFSDGLKTNGSEIIDGIHSINKSIPIAGGRAGDNGYMKDTIIFCNEGTSNNGVVAVALNSDSLGVYTNYSLCWQPIGKLMTVTKAEKNRVYTIDNIPAKDIYRKYLGYDVTSSLPKSATEFPLIIHKNNLQIARVAFFDFDDDSLGFIGNIEEGDKVTFAFGNIDMLVERSSHIMKSISKISLESIFVYSCTARRVYMQEKIGDELIPLRNIANVSGYFTYGEYFHLKSNNALLNMTTTILGLSENPIDDINYEKVLPQNLKAIDNFIDGKEINIIKVLNNLINAVTSELEDINRDLYNKNIELQKNHELMIEMEKAASMGNLIGGIAHNIKTPLMGCSGAIDIIGSRVLKLKNILDSLNEEESLKKEFTDVADNIILWQSRIKDYLNYIGDVINTVKDQVAPADRLEKFTIGDLVNRISILMKNRLKEKNCAIIYKTDLQDDYEVRGEISYLIQALNNLIDNAIDAYEGKPGEIEFYITQEGNNILFSVKDYGYGISNDIINKLFNQMITTKGKDGSGLGLYMSKILIKSKLNGDIYLNTNADKGTEFIILIPERK